MYRARSPKPARRRLAFQWMATLVLAGAALFPPPALAEEPATPIPATTTGRREPPPAPPRRPELASATRALQTIEAQGLSVQGELRKARLARDRQRTECLGDLLTRLHVAARAGRAYRDAIASAPAEDQAGVDRELTRIVHLRDRTVRLLSEAARCGERAVVIEGGKNTVVRVLPPNLPEAAGYPRPPAARRD